VSGQYLPISEYAAIGNLATVALVARNGSIDWCCLPHMDDPSVFGALLDDRRGGRFRVHATGGETGEQRYLPATNVVETTFKTTDGVLTVTDLMPVFGDLRQPTDQPAPPEMHRLLSVTGSVEVSVEWSPRFDYARADTSIEREGQTWVARAGDRVLCLDGVGSDGTVAEGEDGPTLRATFVPENITRSLVTWWGGPDERPSRSTEDVLDATVTAWRSWSGQDRGFDRSWAAPYEELVLRSELALKLLCFRPTGAIAAAATTSLPETIGGIRNWDYRFTWIRDASLTVQALRAVGHEDEARACEMVGQPDDGIWEMRGEPRHYTYSQLMLWVGLDRAIQLAERYGFDAVDLDRWRRSRGEVRDLVLERGFDEDRGSFIQRFGEHELDATNLLIPIHELLAVDDPRVQSTIDATIAGLTEDDLVYRYVMDDGLPGKEGAFVLCTFWLVDALALSGRVNEARRVFEKLCGRANHVGLFSEQIDPATGEFLGNFPQAFSHLGLINSAIYLAYAEGRERPVEAPVGTPEHRREAGRPVPASR